MPRPAGAKPGLNPTIPPERYRTKATSSSGKFDRTQSASQLATLLDVDRGTVKRWIDAGLPIAAEPEGKGGSYTLDVADVVKWLMGKAAADAAPSAPDPIDGVRPAGWESQEEADRRRAIASANIAEIEEEIKARSVVPIEAVADLIREEMATCRAKLENIGSTLAGRTARLTDPAHVKAVADSLVAEAVKSLVGDLSSLMDGPDE